MIDNWKGDGGYRFEVMEGGGMGGGGPDWGDFPWWGKGLTVLVVLIGAVLIIFVIGMMIDSEAERQTALDACKKAAPTPYEYFKCK